MTDPNARIDRLAAAAEQAIDEEREPLPDWRAAVADVLQDLYEAVRHGDEGRSADAAMHARLAIGNLAGIWYTPDEKDRIYLGEEQL